MQRLQENQETASLESDPMRDVCLVEKLFSLLSGKGYTIRNFNIQN